MQERTLISSGTVWEKKYGYSRAVRVGNLITVAGTTAVDETGAVVGAGSPFEQAKFIFQKIEKALIQAGASIKDVVRVRTFITDISRWEEVGRAHGEVFGAIRPATSMVEVSKLIDPAMMVEIEAEAIITD